MSKKRPKLDVDFEFGIPEIIPSTQEAFDGEQFNTDRRKEEKGFLKVFKKKVSDTLSERVKDLDQFPTKREVFVFIVQYFSSEAEYGKRDVDNFCKTILDLLVENKLYFNDNQVRTVLATKKVGHPITDNFAYVALKELKTSQDIEIIKSAGLERSVTLYYDLRKRGVFSDKPRF